MLWVTEDGQAESDGQLTAKSTNLPACSRINRFFIDCNNFTFSDFWINEPRFLTWGT